MFVSLSPVRGRCQDGIKCARMVLEGMPVKDHGEGAKGEDEGQKLKGASLTLRRGQREEGWTSSLRKAQCHSWGPGTGAVLVVGGL